MAEKDSFVLYNSYYDLIEDLNMEQRGLLLTAILEHARGENQPVLDPIVKIAYRVIAAQLDRDRKKWEETCAKRAEAGKRGGIASGQSRRQSKQNEANKANASNAKQTEANASKPKQSQANEAEYEYESESESENENDSVYDSEYGIESESIPQAVGSFVDSLREKFIELFGREPDRPFLSGVRNKLDRVSMEDVWEVMTQAASKHPRNPEAYILAALNDCSRKQHIREKSPAAEAIDQNQPLADWEKEWLEDVRRGRERFAREQDGEQPGGEEANV